MKYKIHTIATQLPQTRVMYQKTGDYQKYKNG